MTEDKISGLYEDFHRLTMDLEAKVMKIYELLEEWKMAEEKLHREVQHMESSHLIEFKKLENEYKTRIVIEKLELEKSMNDDFQGKVANINDKHVTVLNNLKKEHAASLNCFAEFKISVSRKLPNKIKRSLRR